MAQNHPSSVPRRASRRFSTTLPLLDLHRNEKTRGQELQAIGRLKRKGQPELERLKRRLEQVYESQNGKVEVRMCDFRD